MDIDKLSSTFNEFIRKLNFPVDKITSEDNKAVNEDYDIKISKNG